MKLRSSPSWFGSAFLPSSQSWQSNGKKHTGLGSDEHLLAIRGSTYLARAIRRKPREEQWSVDSVKAVLVRPWELRVRTDTMSLQAHPH